MTQLPWFRVRYCLAARLVTLLASSCTGSSLGPEVMPLSAPCESCLSGGADGGTGCKTELDSCTAQAACNDYVVCELQNGCYASPPDGSCEARVGCSFANDASPEARNLASAFEQCARTSCAASCGFLPP